MIFETLMVVGKNKPLQTRNKIAGTITVDGQPAKRFVAVYDRRNFAFIAATVSNQNTGKWEITGIPEFPERTLLVVATDTTGNYNAEVADYISQVATV